MTYHFNLTDTTLVGNRWTTVSAPSNEARVSPEGVRLINEYIRQNTVVRSLPENFDYRLNVQSDSRGFSGKIAKRIRAYLYKVKGISLADSDVAIIGAIANNNSVIASYSLRFTNRFNWQAGAFGDAQSCFWGGRNGARSIMRRNGGLAALIKRPPTTEGLFFGDTARAWIAPRTPDGSSFIVYNGYGFFPGNVTLSIATLLAERYSLKVKEIDLSNQGLSVGTLWINGNRESDTGALKVRRGLGYLVGTPDALTIGNHDLGYVDPSIHDCHTCGTRVTTVAEDDHVGGYKAPDKHVYCNEHYHVKWANCEVCDTPVLRSHPAVWTDGHNYYCPDHIDSIRCSFCNTPTHATYNNCVYLRCCINCARGVGHCIRCQRPVTNTETWATREHPELHYCRDCYTTIRRG